MTSMSTPIKRSSKGTKWLVEQTTIMRPIQRQLHLQIAALVSLVQLKDVHIQLNNDGYIVFHQPNRILSRMLPNTLSTAIKAPIQTINNPLGSTQKLAYLNLRQNTAEKIRLIHYD
jgi:hypothetical protein